MFLRAKLKYIRPPGEEIEKIKIFYEKTEKWKNLSGISDRN